MIRYAEDRLYASHIDILERKFLILVSCACHFLTMDTHIRMVMEFPKGSDQTKYL